MKICKYCDAPTCDSCIPANLGNADGDFGNIDTIVDCIDTGTLLALQSWFDLMYFVKRRPAEVSFSKLYHAVAYTLYGRRGELDELEKKYGK